MSVLILMNKEGSIRKQRLSFEGRGDTDPVAPNDSKSNKAKNRRVEIYLRD
jgi:type VI secretion system protein ImpK